MDQNTKQRLVGIAVIFALAVIFLPLILDGSGIRKNTLEVVIPPQPVIKNNPEFEQKIVELHAKVEDLPSLESQFVDERSSENANQIERKTEQAEPKDSGSKSEAVQSQPASKQQTQPEVEVTRVGGDTWVLQVGSYKDRKKALSQRDKLRKSNIAAVFIEKFSIDNQPVYRVRLGPFLNRDQSKVALNKIKAKYDIDGLIMKYHK